MRPLPQTAAQHRRAANRLRWGMVLLAGLSLFGCTAMRQQIAERRQACDAYCKRACTAKSEGYPDQADLLLNEAVRQRPDDVETRLHLAESLWECDRPQDALGEYRELAELHPREIRVHQRLAVIFWTMGQRDLAAQAAERALRLDPNSADALLVKARCAAARGDFDAAVATYIRLSRAAPNLVAAKLELAEVHVQRGYSHQACTVLRDVVSQPHLSGEQHADAEWKLGLTYASTDRWTEAATHLGNAIEQRKSSTGDWQLLLAAKTLAGQDVSSVQSKAVMASGRQPIETDSSAWIALRDRLAVRGELMVHAGNSPSAPSGVTRADFTRSAQAIPR